MANRSLSKSNNGEKITVNMLDNKVEQLTQKLNESENMFAKIEEKIHLLNAKITKEKYRRKSLIEHDIENKPFPDQNPKTMFSLKNKISIICQGVLVFLIYSKYIKKKIDVTTSRIN